MVKQSSQSSAAQPAQLTVMLCLRYNPQAGGQRLGVGDVTSSLLVMVSRRTQASNRHAAACVGHVVTLCTVVAVTSALVGVATLVGTHWH
jgi:hypothetical protein